MENFYFDGRKLTRNSLKEKENHRRDSLESRKTQRELSSRSKKNIKRLRVG